MLATRIRQKDGIFYFASCPAKEILSKVRFISRYYGEDEQIAAQTVPQNDEIAQFIARIERNDAAFQRVVSRAKVRSLKNFYEMAVTQPPIPGTVRKVAYIPGSFLNADLDKASEENERQHILVENANGTRIGFTQIAGLVARRIVPFVKAGDIVGLGQRIGLIRFGSRVDVYLPAGTGHRVALGQRTIAGETVIAKLGEAERTIGAAQ